jgi:hypothetical protein
MAATVRFSCSPLENLPLLVLESICEDLATTDFRRRGLFAFSMVSKRCCAVAARERFERIHLAVENGQQLRRLIVSWDDILRIENRARHVRRVKVTGRMKMESENSSQTHLTDAIQTQVYSDPNDSDPDEDSDADEDAFSAPPRHSSLAGDEPAITLEFKAMSNRVWQPLARFLLRCPGLKHFIWASTHQIPRCILDHLQQQLPSCRLHINTFSLRSLYQWRNQLHDIDADEYALVTFPSLSSISAVSNFFNDDGRMDYNGEAILQVVQSSPSLQSVRMCYQVTGNSPGLLEAIRGPRPVWGGFFSNKPTQSKRGRLTKLALRGRRSRHLECLRDWIHCTDFSMLRSLDLGSEMNPDALQTLVDMAEQGIFKCLRRLSLCTYDNEQIAQVTAANFLSALQPLESLDIQGHVNGPTMDSILHHHGSSLERLRLPIKLTKEGIKAIGKECPHVRDLRLSIRRTHGDQQEVRIYEALGSISPLEKLSLTLDCEDPEISGGMEGDDQEEPQAQIQRMRSALINSAIDSHLAQSIFLVILAANRAARADIAPSFRRLKLRCYCGDSLSLSFREMQGWVGRSWTCERERADTHSQEAVVREIGVRNRMWIQESLMEDFAEGFKWRDYGKHYMPTWEAVFPEAKGKTNWMDEWHSFPLWKEH